MNEYHLSRTISAMLGKGNQNHNSRKFIANNVDPSRTSQNIEYINMNIHTAYYQLFDEALQRYNAKQKRKDRVIKDYYNKIRTSKQEKTFYEVIIQIGNCKDTNAKSPEGELAKIILDEYMNNFQKRNPSLFVFSAHLHMDEETPHLHIDFIPFITNSKRGLDTRVSLKQALAQLGFKGGSRSNTEWNQWIASEKQELSKVMEKYNVHWLQLGTHEKHLSVLNYEKKQREEEVEALTDSISYLSLQKDHLDSCIESSEKQYAAIESKLYEIKDNEQELYRMTNEINKEELWEIPQPTKLMSAKTYLNKIIEPYINKLKKIIDVVITKYNRLYREVKQLNEEIGPLRGTINYLQRENGFLTHENMKLQNQFNKLKKVIGRKEVERILEEPIRKKKTHDRER